MAVNSRAKGASGEVELSHVLQKYGYEDAKRGQQHSGLAGNPDVVGMSDLIHIECKYGVAGHGNMEQWMAQSVRDAREGEMPVVMHRKVGKKARGNPWFVTVSMDDFMTLWKIYEREWSE